MDVVALRAQIARDRANGLDPFLVVASAGTVDIGAIDDLQAIAELCREEELWFHVDGAFGALAILSGELAPRLAGIEVRQLRPSDLTPTAVWAAVDNRMHRTWERAVKYYENLRLVYEVQTRLQEWSEQEEEERRAAAGKRAQEGSSVTTSNPAQPASNADKESK